MRCELFTRRHCPNCPPLKEFCEKNLECETIDCDTDAGLALARDRGVQSTPTAIFYDSAGEETARARTASEAASIMRRGLAGI